MQEVMCKKIHYERVKHMNNILYQLYEGELQPYSKYLNRVPGHLRRREQCAEKYHAILKRLQALDPELWRSVDDYLDESFRVDREDIPEAFMDGFRLGAGLMMEILME